MPIQKFSKEKQAIGNFNYGEILENKPIGFPQDGGELKTLLKSVLLGTCLGSRQR